MDLPLQAPSGVSRSGSVKRAREKAEMERLQREAAASQGQSPPRKRMGQQDNTPPSRPRQPLPAAIAASRNGPGIGSAISRPSPAPQWPLPTQPNHAELNDDSSQPYQPPTGRGKPPQRPPRPSHVPSILDASKIHEYTPTFQYQPAPERSQGGSQSKEAQQYLDELTSPGILSPMTMTSRASTTSSVGTIPDFPVPMPRGSTGLGPPPSSRRGPSSYYSMQSFVTPIPEESPRTQTTHSSYASSGAIPANWGDMSYGYDTDERSFLDDDIMEEEESKADREGIVRSASVGKRAKPSMITTKGAEKVDQSQGGVLGKTKNLVKMGAIDNSEPKATPQNFQDFIRSANAPPIPRVVQPTPRDTTWPTFGGPDSPLEGNKELDDDMMSSSSDSESTLAPSPHAIEMEKLSPAAILQAARANSTSPSRNLTEKEENEIQYRRTSAIRRPPRLDMNALRDAEARGSLTSLPDLIRRATKLASMMNEGKRPASRLNNLNDFPSMTDEKSEKSSARKFPHYSRLS